MSKKEAMASKEIIVNDASISFGEDEQDYQVLLDSISASHTRGRAQAIRATNETILYTNWNNGRHIVAVGTGRVSHSQF
jgi:hypothetical protein